jgi:hypothetical protein
MNPCGWCTRDACSRSRCGNENHVVGVLVSGCLGREPTPPIKGTPKSVNLFVFLLLPRALDIVSIGLGFGCVGAWSHLASVVHLHEFLLTPASTYRFFASHFQSASYYTSPRLTMYLPTFFASLPPMLVRIAIFEVIVLHRSGTHPYLRSVRTNTSLGQYIATPRVSAVCYVKELGRLGVAPYLPRWAVGRWRGCSLSTLQMDGEGFEKKTCTLKSFFVWGKYSDCNSLIISTIYTQLFSRSRI